MTLNVGMMAKITLEGLCKPQLNDFKFEEDINFLYGSDC